MKLNLGTFEVKDVILHTETMFANGVLYIDAQEVRELVLQDALG